MVKKVLGSVLLALCFSLTIHAQSAKSLWIDSVFQSLEPDDKIGQLMMIPIYPELGDDHINEIEDQIKSHHVGGIIFMNGGPIQIATIINRFQKVSPVPLLVGMDAERGLGHIVDSTITFPNAITLGAVRNNETVYQTGATIARQMKTLGIHLNFAPTADLSREFRYDSIDRSFGESRPRVAAKALAYMKGLQDNGVIACAKHFPVKGITVLSINKGLPELSPYIDSLEVYPFKKMFEAGLTGVIPATTDFPLFYEKKKTIKKNNFSPSTLSSLFLGDWLKRQMNFNGLVFVNILHARDLTGKYRNGESETFAFQAGNDVLLFPQSLGPAIRKIRRLTRKEEQYEAQLDNSVKKILAAKYDAGLNELKPVSLDFLLEELNTPEAKIQKQKVYSEAITVLKNNEQTLPLQNLETRNFAVLSIGKEGDNPFSKVIENYTHIDKFDIRLPADTVGVYEQLSCYSTVIIGLYPQATPWQREILSIIDRLRKNCEVVVCDFSLPYTLVDVQHFPIVVEAFTDDKIMQELVAQTVFGSIPTNGELPVNVSASLREGDGYETHTLSRLGYSFPEDVAMDSKTLNKIKGIAYEAIKMGATPGCHVLVAKDGKVIYNQSFGWQTYENKIPVNENTLYDLASVTKVSATLQTVMFMYDRGMIDINKKASVYLPELRESNKKDFTIKDILTHQAGLWPFLPFWAQTMKDTLYLPDYYSHVPSATYPFTVAENLYGAASIKDSLWTWIINAKVRDKVARTPFDYRYSDMGFYIMQHLAEKMLNQPMQDFLDQNLYGPLGAYTTGYLPRLRFPKEQIAPTEDDKLFRHSLLTGMVHDQGAAMHGGIAGHAGLFSDANDLAKLGQMLLQEGTYGGVRYYKPETVRFFTRQQFSSSRRGLGWDKPTVSEWNGPTSLYASPLTFGHTGFTGTCIWVDPEFNLVYIFLSNRVHPDMTNNKLLTANIRSRIQDVIYESIFNYAQYGSGTCPDKPIINPNAKR